MPVKEQSDSRTIAPAVNDDAITVVVHATHRQRDVLGAYHPSATAVANDGSVFARLAFRSQHRWLSSLTNHPGQITVVQPGKDSRNRVDHNRPGIKRLTRINSRTILAAVD